MRTAGEAFDYIRSVLPKDEAILARLHRGYQIVTGYGYEVKWDGRGSYIISKASTALLEDNSKAYYVSADSCTCPDFPSARGGLCKHRLAVMIIEKISG